MIQPIHRPLLATLLIGSLFSVSATAQSLLDVSVGTSRQDNVYTNIALRRQFSGRFRAGVELQVAAPRYRFISGKPITEGYAYTIAVPLLWKLYERDRIRLDIYGRVGIRQQGVLDPDGNDRRDVRLNSTALVIDPGLLVSIRATDKLQLQSGVTLPVFVEIAPSTLLENNVTTVLAGLSYHVSDRKVFFTKALMGPAAGSDGDAQKFVWSVQAGFRFSLGKSRSTASLIMEPSY
jgi:hypothetical protein